MAEYATREYESWYWIGKPILIHRLDGYWSQSPKHHYDYTKNKSQCPVCGSVGFVWGGWFSCDGGRRLEHIAVVETGDVFVRAAQQSKGEKP